MIALLAPWAGHPAGAILSLPAADEASLIRAGAAVCAAEPDAEAAPVAAPVRKPAPARRTK